jgi:dolichol-phosphate mannosyltransferase
MALKLSIVIPVYQNELNLPSSIEQLLALESQLPSMELELIFVDDGSLDRSYSILETQWQLHKRQIKVLKLCRNFGQTSAIRAGIRNATGDCIGIISADLQDPPQLFIEMVDVWRGGAKVVIAERDQREEGIVHQCFSRLYWRLVSLFAIKNYPKDGFDFCLFDRKVATAINQISERNTNIFAIIFWLGFSYKILPYKRRLREQGKSQWTFKKKIRLFVDTFVGFSHMPIRTISYLGLVISFFSFCFAIWAILSFILMKNPYPGWTSLVTIISCLGGLTLFTLGIIGEYLWRILDETRHRPVYLTETILSDSLGEKNDSI